MKHRGIIVDNPIKVIYKEMRVSKVFYLFLLLIFLAGYLYLHSIWDEGQDFQRKEAISLVKTMKAVMADDIHSYVENFPDVDRVVRARLIYNLRQIQVANKDVESVFFLIEKDGKIIQIDDKERTYEIIPIDKQSTEVHQRPQVFYDIFTSYDPLISQKYNTIYGKKISALISLTPYINSHDKDTLRGVIGVDYLIWPWYQQTLKHFAMAVLLVLFFFIAYIFFYANIIYSRLLKREQMQFTESERSRKRSAEIFEAVFNQSPFGISLGSGERYLLSDRGEPFINPAYEEITGRKSEELVKLHWKEMTHPDDIAEDEALNEDLRSGKIDGYEIEKRYLRPNGDYVWSSVRLSKLQLYEDDNYYYITIAKDITKEREMEEALDDANRSKAVLLDNLPGAAFRCKNDRNWTMEFISDGIYDISGYKPEELINNKCLSYSDLILEESREAIWKKWQKALKAKTAISDEYQILDKEGRLRWISERSVGIYDSEGNLTAVEGFLMDITDRKTSELEIHYLSEHDPVTDLKNRQSLASYLIKNLDINQEINRAFVFLRLPDISTLQYIKGGYYTENLLQLMAKKLVHHAGKNIRVFSISSSSFGICFNKFESREELLKRLRAIMNDISINPEGGSFQIKAGIIEPHQVPLTVNNGNEIIKFAHLASEFASEDNHYIAFFDPEMEESILRNEIIKKDIIRACKEEDFIVEFQPIYEVATNRIVSFEALVRLESSEYGLLYPKDFIHIAEETRDIVDLGRCVLENACKFLNRLYSEGYKDILVSYNTSIIEFLREDYVDFLTAMIEKYQILPGTLGIELTESAFTDKHEIINEKAEKLKKINVAMAIDDFGTGYSNLARERELELAVLKIEKSFIDKLLLLEEEEAITSDIISMAHKLGQRVVAEGVETQLQLEYLIKYKCDFIQGYYFSKPVLPQEALNYLKNFEGLQ